MFVCPSITNSSLFRIFISVQDSTLKIIEEKLTRTGSKVFYPNTPKPWNRYLTDSDSSKMPSRTFRPSSPTVQYAPPFTSSVSKTLLATTFRPTSPSVQYSTILRPTSLSAPFSRNFRPSSLTTQYAPNIRPTSAQYVSNFRPTYPVLQYTPTIRPSYPPAQYASNFRPTLTATAQSLGPNCTEAWFRNFGHISVTMRNSSNVRPATLCSPPGWPTLRELDEEVRKVQPRRFSTDPCFPDHVFSSLGSSIDHQDEIVPSNTNVSSHSLVPDSTRFSPARRSTSRAPYQAARSITIPPPTPQWKFSLQPSSSPSVASNISSSSPRSSRSLSPPDLSSNTLIGSLVEDINWVKSSLEPSSPWPWREEEFVGDSDSSENRY